MLLQGNYIDLVIVAILLYFLSLAWRVGFWIVLADFFSFALSLLLALYGYQFFAAFLVANFSFSHALAKAIGFLVMAVIAEGILSYVFNRLVVKIPTKLWKNWWSKLLATIPALGEGIILISFLLILVMSAPVTPKIKMDIGDSKIGGAIVKRTSTVESKLKDVFGEVIEGSLTYLTIEPNSNERVEITSEVGELQGDRVSELEIFYLVNSEREKLGLKQLTLREELVPVARVHAQDMWERSYFGHVSPDGEDVGNRLDKAGVYYLIAGENLAMAPTVTTAHNGLMNSEGHRANILDTRFKRIGIGVIDNGVQGKIFVQIFTD